MSLKNNMNKKYVLMSLCQEKQHEKNMFSCLYYELSLHIPSKKWGYFEKEKTWTEISDCRACL